MYFEVRVRPHDESRTNARVNLYLPGHITCIRVLCCPLYLQKYCCLPVVQFRYRVIVDENLSECFHIVVISLQSLNEIAKEVQFSRFGEGSIRVNVKRQLAFSITEGLTQSEYGRREEIMNSLYYELRRPECRVRPAIDTLCRWSPLWMIYEDGR